MTSMTSTKQTWDITPTHPGYSGPRITLEDRGGDTWVARADDRDVRPWVLVPVDLLMYIDQEAIKTDYQPILAEAYNSALEGAFPLSRRSKSWAKPSATRRSAPG